MVQAVKSSRATALPPAERRAAIIEATRPLLVEHGETAETVGLAPADIKRAVLELRNPRGPAVG